MIHPRIQDPPEYIEAEAKILAAAFFEQFDDDDIIPNGAYDRYFREHGSKELIRYLNETFGS